VIEIINMFGVMRAGSPSSPKYMPLQDDLEGELKMQPRTLLGTTNGRKFIVLQFLPWTLAVFFATMSAYLLLNAQNVLHHSKSLSAAYATDFGMLMFSRRLLILTR
jgi:hypothetical protein